MSDNQSSGQYSPNNSSDPNIQNNAYNQGGVYAYQEPVEEEKGMSIASMVLGIIGFVAWCLPIAGYPVTIIGLIMGIKGMKKGGKGMAIAGIIMCSITLVLTLINSVLGAMMSVADLL